MRRSRRMNWRRTSRNRGGFAQVQDRRIRFVTRLETDFTPTRLLCSMSIWSNSHVIFSRRLNCRHLFWELKYNYISKLWKSVSQSEYLDPQWLRNCFSFENPWTDMCNLHAAASDLARCGILMPLCLSASAFPEGPIPFPFPSPAQESPSPSFRAHFCSTHDLQSAPG